MTAYQNLTDHELVIPNVGLLPPGGTIETDVELNSPHLKPITKQIPAAPVSPQPVQAAPEPKKEGDN
jgi:hypothetical protein